MSKFLAYTCMECVIQAKKTDDPVEQFGWFVMAWNAMHASLLFKLEGK